MLEANRGQRTPRSTPASFSSKITLQYKPLFGCALRDATNSLKSRAEMLSLSKHRTPRNPAV
ncbi:Uncharacterized protein DAT39_008244, partial [Clarias magur]